MPLVKLVLPLLLGIFSFDFLDIPLLYIALPTAVIFIAFVIVHFSVSTLKTKKRVSILLYLLMFLVGASMIIAKHLSQQKRHYSHYKSGFAYGYITQALKETDKSYKTIVEVHSVTDSQSIQHVTNGKLLVYFEKDSLLSSLEIGDELIFPLKINEVAAPKNPKQFDYKKYLVHKSAFYQTFLKSSQVVLNEKSKTYWVRRTAQKISEKAQLILETYLHDATQLALAKGILLGISDEIDNELYNDFAYTGILHILSVSGLHVGIIYGILIFFLSFIKDKNKRIRISKAIFITLFIWLFAFVTGLSSACVRAAILFTLLTFAKENKEHFNTINLLAGAAVLQLMLDANLLFDVGFQLSYLAMLGLFLFYKPIYSRFYVRQKWMDWVWQLWAASLAAQVFTVPLSIYYFGNFPTYFLFANIFAIPLSAAILWLSLGLVLLSWIPYLGNILAFLLSYIIKLFIALTTFMAHLPYGKLNTLYISSLQLCLLFIAVTFFTFFVEWKKPKYLLITLGLCLFVIGISYQHSIEEMKSDKLIFYSIAKKDCIAFNQNTQSTIYTSDTLSAKEISFNMQNAQRYFGTRQIQSIILADSSNQQDLLCFQNKTLYRLHQSNQRKSFTTPLKVDYLLLSDNLYLDIEQLKKNYQFEMLLIGCSNDYRHQHIFEKLLKQNNIAFKNLNVNSFLIEL